MSIGITVIDAMVDATPDLALMFEIKSLNAIAVVLLGANGFAV